MRRLPKTNSTAQQTNQTSTAYTPTVGDRILVRRTRSIHGGTGTITGLVLNILTIDGVPDILHLQADGGGRVYLATNQQMAAIGKVQTIEPAPD